MDPPQQNEHNPKREPSAVATAHDLLTQMRDWTPVDAEQGRMQAFNGYLEDKSMAINSSPAPGSSGSSFDKRFLPLRRISPNNSYIEDQSMDVNPQAFASEISVEERFANIERRISAMERDNQILRVHNAILEQEVSSLKRTLMPLLRPRTNAFDLSNNDVDDLQFKQELEKALDSASSGSSLSTLFEDGHKAPSPRSYGKLRSINKVPVPPHKPQDCAFFKRLPPEIRMMIWTLVLPLTRAVKVICSEDATFTMSKAPIPSLLHLCSESRQFALKRYTLAGARWRYLGGTQGGFYFDMRSEFVYSSCSTCHNPAYNKTPLGRRKRNEPICGYTSLFGDKCEIKRLILEWAPDHPPFYTIINFFPEVEEVWIVQPPKVMPSISATLSNFEERAEPYSWETGTDLLGEFLAYINDNQYLLEEDQEIKLKRLRRMEFVGHTVS